MSNKRPWNAQDKAKWRELDSMTPADLVKRCFDAECKLDTLEKAYDVAKGSNETFMRQIRELQSRLDDWHKVADELAAEIVRLQDRLEACEAALRSFDAGRESSYWASEGERHEHEKG